MAAGNSFSLHRNILFIGAGSMAQPIILALLKENQLATPAFNLTVVTGSSPGKNKDALLHLLEKNKLSTSSLTISEKLPPLSLPVQDVIIYCAKPQFIEQILPLYRTIIRAETLFITIAAGKIISSYTSLLPAGTSIIRAMPHLPLAIYGLYTFSLQHLPLITNLLKGLGKPILLENEDEMHRFSVHAASGPAFIAQFILRMMQDGMLLTEIISAFLQLLTEEERILSPHPVSLFYLHWLHLIQYHLGMARGKEVLDLTLHSTLSYLQQTPDLSLHNFINNVRSAKGITNAGLLCMGSPPPALDSFGDAQQHIAQRKLADYCLEQFKAEDSILYAIEAGLRRSFGMELHANEPLYSVNIADIVATIDSLPL